jgi:hypothetical protein
MSSTEALTPNARNGSSRRPCHEIANTDAGKRIKLTESTSQAVFETPIISRKKEATEFSHRWASLEGLVIEVEGNIGSGKSTITGAMKNSRNQVSEYSSEVFCETISNNFLGAFYSDSRRFSFAFQMYVLTIRLYQMEEAGRQAKVEGKMVFLDRSTIGDAVFALLNHKMGNMDSTELEIYRSKF